MDRRRFLAALGLGVVPGCSALDRPPTGTDDRPTGVPTDRESGDGGTGSDAVTATPVETRPLARRGFPETICSEEVFEDPRIYAVTGPAFGSDWRDVAVDGRYLVSGTETGTPTATTDGRTGDSEVGERGLYPDQTVVGLAGDGRARAYPLSVLTHHEIVNDDVGGMADEAPGPVAVTYCPLCNSSLVADRVVDGRAREFLVSGLLWRAPRVYAAAAAASGNVSGVSERGTPPVRNNGNLVMYDRGTESYWIQILTTAICGPFAGTELGVVRSGTASWEWWRREHPDTDVLLPPPHSGTHTPPGSETHAPL